MEGRVKNFWLDLYFFYKNITREIKLTNNNVEAKIMATKVFYQASFCDIFN